MAGTANPLYTSVTGNRFFLDQDRRRLSLGHSTLRQPLYLSWVTELDCRIPAPSRCSIVRRSGNFNLPFVLRFAKGDIQVPASNQRLFLTKSTQIAIRLSQKIWATSSMKSGDPTRNRLVDSFLQTCKTLVISYRYTCDANYANCAHKEEFHLAHNRMARHSGSNQGLGAGGTYDPPDNVTINTWFPDRRRPITACF